MRAEHRAKRIRQLQREVATGTRRKQVRKDAQRELVDLVAKHLRWETRTAKHRTA